MPMIYLSPLHSRSFFLKPLLEAIFFCVVTVFLTRRWIFRWF